MAILSWGKPKIQHTPSINGAPAAGAVWKDIDTPKEDTTKLTPTAGNEVSATEEGGEVVDSRTGKNTYQFEFDVFVKKGQPRPFEDHDGVITGEHAFRLTPEDEACEGMQIDRCALRVEESYTAADGKLLHYVAKCLKPAAGRTVKSYTANGLTLDKTSLYFGSAVDNTGKTVTATSTDNITAATSSESWATVSTSGKVATVKVTANTTGNARTAIVSITADGLTSQVEVLQIPA